MITRDYARDAGFVANSSAYNKTKCVVLYGFKTESNK